MNTRTQVVIGALLLCLMVLLLVLSRRTGHEQFEEAQAKLDSVSLLNTQIDGAVFPLMFELRMDFDLLTANQRELLNRTRTYDEGTDGSNSDRLVTLITRKLHLIEDYKSDQAVFRNSRAIATQVLAELRGSPAFRVLGADQEIDRVELTELAFMGWRDPRTTAALAAALDDASERHPQLLEIAEWQAFDAHCQTLMRYAERLALEMGEVFFLPIPQAVRDARNELEAQFALTAGIARRYQIGLFVTGLVLLAFSAVKAVQVSRYVTLIRKANDELEHRVAQRTEDLSAANAALHHEMEELGRMESRLRLAQKLESIGQLAAGVAHEINTPTQYVSDNVVFISDAWKSVEEVLQEYQWGLVNGERDDGRSRRVWEGANVHFYRHEVPESLAQVSSGLAQISKIVQAMKQFSRLGGDRLQPADLNAAIESTATVARSEWRYVADLDLDLDPSLPRVTCDVSALNQVFLNLLINAAHAIAEVVESDPGTKGRIRISSRALGPWVEIAVSDTGTGIGPELREKVFDPFFTTKEVGKGTGQGLALAYTIVAEQHRGSLTFESEVGRGTCFRIRVPVMGERTSADSELSSIPAARIA